MVNEKVSTRILFSSFRKFSFELLFATQLFANLIFFFLKFLFQTFVRDAAVREYYSLRSENFLSNFCSRHTCSRILFPSFRNFSFEFLFATHRNVQEVLEYFARCTRRRNYHRAPNKFPPECSNDLSRSLLIPNRREPLLLFFD